jgi:hypothetical protein
MTRDTERRERRAEASLRLRRSPTLTIERLEERQLLSMWQGPTRSRPVYTGGAYYTVALTGPGYETVTPLASNHKLLAINLFGTTQASNLSVSLMSARRGYKSGHLQIGQINVQSGQLGGVQAAGAADLVGSITPLNGSVSSLSFNSIGPKASIDIHGSLGGLSTTGGVNLGPTGKIQIDGDLTGPVALGALALDGGQFAVGHDISGSFATGGLSIQQDGQLSVGHSLSGGINDSGDLDLTTNGAINIAQDLGGLTVGQNVNLDSGGRIVVGNDLNGPLTVGESLNLSNNAQIAVGRDLTGGVNVTGNINLNSGGKFAVARDLSSLTVNGNLVVGPTGSLLAVGGNLNGLTVNGFFQGQGTSSPDLIVGLDLNNLKVLGGGANQGGIQKANIAVGKDIVGIDVRHGIFDSFITAGVLIDGGPASSTSIGNIGPDGTDAILNSEIRAGVQISNLTINGNVRSDFPTNPSPTGYPTRIVAGEDRAGNFTSGGNLDNFQILGQLIDAVLAASVKPNGGDGTLPTFSYNSPPPVAGNAPGDLGYNTYDAPAGTITGGTVGMPTAYANFSELSYYNETLTGVSYNTTLDPTIDDSILPGAINASYASTPSPADTLSDPTTILPLPTTSTVLGGVISTPHDDRFDYAGIFAADTSGVFVGKLPS